MMTRRSRLVIWDRILGLDSKPTEFLTSLITLGIGIRVAEGQSVVLQQVANVNEILSHWLPQLGWALVIGAIIQIVGIYMTIMGWVLMGRWVRWGSSVIDGAIWVTLILFMTGTVPLTDSIYLIYLALLINDGWIVMGIAYRGYSGRSTD